jgi:hypothetical protein
MSNIAKVFYSVVFIVTVVTTWIALDNMFTWTWDVLKGSR